MTRVAAPWRQRRAAHTAVFVLAVAVAAAQLSTLVGAAAAPPLPVGTDPAMRAAADNRSHSTPSVPSPQPSPMRPEAQPTKAAAGRGNGANAPNHAMDADQPPAAGLSALEDLMKDGCFAPSSDLAAYNEYGFRKWPAGSQLGAWFVAAGDVDEYYEPAVEASPAARGGIPVPSNDDSSNSSTATPAGGAEDDAEDEAAVPSGDDSELSRLLPPGASSGCKTVLDINGERPASILQTFVTVPGGSYCLEFSFAGDALPHNLGPPPHRVPSFKSMAVFWDGTKVGDVFINALDKQNAGMGWDKASYLLTTTSPASTLVIMSTTKGRSGLAVADFKLYNVTGLPNGGLAAPTIQPMPNTAADSKEPAPSTTTPTGSRGRHGHGASVLFALVSVAILISVGVMVLGGNDAWGSGNLLAALPTFWRRSEDGYGVLGFAHGGGNAAAGEGGYQASSSSYQRAAAAVELGRWSGGGGGSGGGGKGKGGRRGGDNEGDGNSSDDEEVMFTQPRREKGKGESKRDDGEWGRRKHEV